MPSLAKILSLLLTLGLAGGMTQVSAAETKALPPAETETYSSPGRIEEEEVGRGQRGRAGPGADNQRAMMEKLNLTPDQQKKVVEIRRKYAEQQASAQGDRPKMAAIMQKQRQEIRALLTPEQQKQFDQVQGPARGRAGAARGPGRGAATDKAEKKK